MGIPGVAQSSTTSTMAVQTSGSNATAAQQNDPVDQAVDQIKDKLSTDFWGGDFAVSHGDVKAIVEIFDGLNAQQAQEVVARLDQDGTLDTMAEQMVDSSFINGGLSSSELTDFFNDMAGKLDGDALKTLSDAFAQTNGNTGGIGVVEKLGQAVANHAPDSVKVDFVEAMAASTTDKPQYSETPLFSPVSFSHTGDAEALAIGHVLASLSSSPAAAEQAFDALSPEQLDAVMAAAVDETVTYSQSGVTASFNGELAGRILESASHIADADIKAKVFDSGATVLQHLNNDFGFPVAAIGKNAAAETIGNGLADIIDSDTTGVVAELAFNQDTYGGTAISVYAKQMLNTGQEARLGEQMGRLQFGNGLNEDPIARLETSITLPTGSVRYENAGALGHFVAGVYNAAESISSDVQQQQALVTSVLKSVLTVVDKVKISGPVSMAAGVGKEWVGYAVDAAIQDPGSSAAEQMERAAIPIDPATDEIGIGDSAMSAFNDRISQVQRLGNP